MHPGTEGVKMDRHANRSRNKGVMHFGVVNEISIVTLTKQCIIVFIEKVQENDEKLIEKNIEVRVAIIR